LRSEKEGITTIVDIKRIAPGVKVIAVSGATDTLALALGSAPTGR
jgi:hypothetical protein